MFRTLRTLLLAGAVAACLTQLLHGQAAAINGEISGTVTDASGAAVAGAVTRIVNPGTGFKQATRTADSGLYRFGLLPLGTYDLTVQAPGFTEARHTGIVVNAGAAITVNIPLQVSGTSTQVEVTAAAASADPSRTSLGSTLDYTATNNLPLVSRNPYNFILFQPNVSGRANTEFGVPRKVNANGFNGRINYQLGLGPPKEQLLDIRTSCGLLSW